MKFSRNNWQHAKRLSRRDFLKLLKAAAIELALLAAGGGVYSFLIEPKLVKSGISKTDIAEIGSRIFGNPYGSGQ